MLNNSGRDTLKSKREYYENGDIPWLLSGEVCQKEITSSKNFITRTGVENSSAKLYPANSVLIAMYGATAGQAGILRFEATSNQAVCAILPNKQYLPEFIYYFFLNEKEALVAKAAGNAQPNISQKKIKDTTIPVPPSPSRSGSWGSWMKPLRGSRRPPPKPRKPPQRPRTLPIRPPIHLLPKRRRLGRDRGN